MELTKTVLVCFLSVILIFDLLLASPVKRSVDVINSAGHRRRHHHRHHPNHQLDTLSEDVEFYPISAAEERRVIRQIDASVLHTLKCVRLFRERRAMSRDCCIRLNRDCSSDRWTTN